MTPLKRRIAQAAVVAAAREWADAYGWPAQAGPRGLRCASILLDDAVAVLDGAPGMCPKRVASLRSGLDAARAATPEMLRDRPSRRERP